MLTRFAYLLPITLLCLSCGRNPEEPESALLWSSGSRAGVDAVVSLGTLGGPGSTAFSINNRGEVVGISGNLRGEPHAFLWTAVEGMLDLGYGAALRINDRGQVLVRRPDGFYVWTRDGGDRPTGLDLSHTLKDFNNLGHAVGRTALDRAFFWTPQTGLVLLDQLGVGWAEASALSDADVIVGSAFTERLQGSFILRPGEDPELLPEYPGAHWSQPVDVNTRGQVLCAALLPVGAVPFRSFLWSREEGIVDVAQGSPAALNEQGHVVGTSLQRKGGWSYAFYWDRPGGVKTLRWQVPRPLGSTAYDLNDAGQAVGTCTWVDSKQAGGRSGATLWTLR